MKEFFQQQRPHNGLTYKEFLESARRTAEQPLKGLTTEQRRYVFYARYNLQRSEQMHEAVQVSERLRAAVEAIDEPQLWMVLTEAWCIDSALNLPLFIEVARLNEHITVRILPRDANLDIMDQYLTNGGRGIPKVVAYTEDGCERFTWGPRPAEAQALRNRLLAEGVEADLLYKTVLDWYTDGSWQQVDTELAEALENMHLCTESEEALTSGLAR